MADKRVVTHHVNVANPRGGKVTTFEPGANTEDGSLPQWAHDVLAGEDHVAYPVENPAARAVVAGWQAQKAQAEAVRAAQAAAGKED